MQRKNDNKKTCNKESMLKQMKVKILEILNRFLTGKIDH